MALLQLMMMTNSKATEIDCRQAHGEPNLRFILSLHKITYVAISKNFNGITQLTGFTVDLHTKITVEWILAYQKGLSFDHLLFFGQKNMFKPNMNYTLLYILTCAEYLCNYGKQF